MYVDSAGTFHRSVLSTAALEMTTKHTELGFLCFSEVHYHRRKTGKQMSVVQTEWHFSSPHVAQSEQ